MFTFSIVKMIMHELDLSKGNPTIFPQLIDLSKIPTEVTDFFLGHIGNVMTNRKIQNCIFNSQSAEVLQKCISISNNLANDQLFIQNTGDMAKKLFTAMQSSSSTSSGTLIFVLLHNNNNSTHHLAILKMDPNKAVQVDITNYTFKVQSDILPSLKENLHKCAIIRMDSNLWSDSIHLRVLDKQQVKGEVSKFFLLSFLESKKVVNDKSMTQLVHSKLLEHALSESIIEVDQLLDFSSEIDTILCPGRDVDIDRDLESLFETYLDGEAEVKEAINSFKLKLLSEDENVYFRFKAEKDKHTTVTYSDDEKTIKIQFPLQSNNKTVFVSESTEEGIPTKIIKIKGIKLNEKFV